MKTKVTIIMLLVATLTNAQMYVHGRFDTKMALEGSTAPGNREIGSSFNWELGLGWFVNNNKSNDHGMRMGVMIENHNAINYAKFVGHAGYMYTINSINYHDVNPVRLIAELEFGSIYRTPEPSTLKNKLIHTTARLRTVLIV